MSYRSAEADAVFHAVSDATRRAIVQRVARRPFSAGELASGFRISRPAVSKHVRVLLRAGLLRERREGRNRFYELNATPLRTVDEWVGQYRAFWQANLRNLKTFVESRGDHG
jgi:DNA-binding transcriptional ArsR family regulator